MDQRQTEAMLEMLGGLYIQTLRNYDMLCLIGDKLGADVVALKDLHQQGYVLSPDPALRLDETDEKPSDNRRHEDGEGL